MEYGSMPFFGKRLLESFSFEIVLSLVFTFILQAFTITNIVFFMTLALCLLINIAYGIICMKVYYTFVAHNDYLKVNLTVYAILALINLIMAAFSFEPVYTYLFYPFKLLMPIGFSKFISAFAVNIVFIASIFIAPLMEKFKP